MPTYKCKRCGNEITLSMKPGQCEFCGSGQFKQTSRGSSKKFVTLESGEVSNASVSGSSPQKLDSSDQTTYVNCFPSKLSPNAKTKQSAYSQPSLPLYSSSTGISVPVKTNPKPIKFRFKDLNLSLPTKWLFLLILGGIGGGGYWLWQTQFDTSDFQKIVLQENFNNPKFWALTNNASIRNGGIYQRQAIRNHYGASIWMGKTFQDVDFSVDAIKTSGANDIPYGLITRVNGKEGQKFYYLFINGQGNFVMGKHDKDSWLHRVGWQKNNAVKKGSRPNRLRIVVKDNLVIGFINGHRVGSFRDDDYQAGRIAVFSMRGRGDQAGIYFDNVLVKERIDQNEK